MFYLRSSAFIGGPIRFFFCELRAFA